MRNVHNPRQIARDLIKNSISSDLWGNNKEFLNDLIRNMKHHPAWNHQVLTKLGQGKFSRSTVLSIHMEYWYAIVQVFTDAILMAQFHSRILDNKFAPGAKMTSRFLITLNLLDELGFVPGLGENEYFQGNPLIAHYPLFNEVLFDLGATPELLQNFSASKSAKQIRDFVEGNYQNFLVLLSILLVTEESAIIVSPALRKASGAAGLDINSGYYTVHGSSSDEDVNAFDDDHQLDIAYVLMQVITPEDYEKFSKICMDYCELWNEFWTYQLEQSKSHSPQLSLQ